MRRWLKRLGLALVGLVVLATVALPAVVGIRPIIGPRVRALTGRSVERTPARLERGRYLTTSVSGCLVCHSETDLKAMFAYVRTIAPVAHRVDNSLPPTDCPRCGLRHGAGNQNKPAE